MTLTTGFDIAVLPSTQAAADSIGDESRFVNKINEVRASEGLAPLSLDAELTAQARIWAEQLRADDNLSHANDLSIGVTANWTKLGENVGVGPEDQLDALFEAFVASPDHYANLMDPDFRFVGVGVVYDDEGRMWTAHRFMAIAPPAQVAAGSTTQPAPTADPQSDAQEDPAPEVLASTDETVAPAPGAADETDGAGAASTPTTAANATLLAGLMEQLGQQGF